MSKKIFTPLENSSHKSTRIRNHKFLTRFIFIIIFLLVFGFLIFNFRKTKKAEAVHIVGPLIAAMKTKVDGYFYVPRINPRTLQVKFLFNNAGLEGDQTGGSGEYPYVPDGVINIQDLSFISLRWNAKEDGANWEYMADIIPDKKIDTGDLNQVGGNYGKSGTYISDLTGVTIVFDVGGELPLDPQDMVEIPAGAASFTVKQNGIPIGAYILFYAVPPPKNVRWWAWSENIGWISFNSLNCDPNNNTWTEGGLNNPDFPNCPEGDSISNYGVSVDSFTGIGYISGYAWSPSLGWLDFDPIGTPPVYPTKTAELDNSTGKVSGWARFLSYGDGWDGWVKLSDNPIAGRNAKYMDSSKGSGGFISLELTYQDKPRVSYLDSGLNLKLAGCDNRFCKSEIPFTGNPGGNAGTQGYTTSLALDRNENPVIVNVEIKADGEDNVWVRRCDDPKCGSQPAAQEPDKINSATYTTSLKLDFVSLGCQILGCPMIAYGSFSPGPTTGTLFVHCDDPYCAGDESAHIRKLADEAPSIDHGVDIELDKNGNPVIVISPIFSDHIKVIRCNDFNCDNVNEYDLPSIVPFIDMLGWLDAELDFSSPGCEILGCPVVFTTAFPSSSAEQFLRCHQPDCSDNSGWKTGFEPSPKTITHPSLELTSGGLPVMVYREQDGEKLVLIRCTDFDCNNFSRLVLDDADETAGQYTGYYADLELDSEDLPFIAYQANKGKVMLMYIACYNTGCKSTVVSHGVTYNSTTHEFSGWAWGSDVTGWISFNCKDRKICDTTTADVMCDTPIDIGCLPYGTLSCVNQRTADGKTACDISNYKVIVNSPPSVTSTSEALNSCAWGTIPQVAPGLAITLNWTYSDPDGDPQNAYEILVDDSFAFPDPKFNHLVEGSSSNSYVLNLSNDDNSDWLSSLAWGTTYYWKVRVKDSSGNWTESLVDDFTTPAHAYPDVDFSWSPQSPSVNEIAQFTDTSKCYDAAGNIVPCASWSWTFPGGNPSASTIQNPQTKFTSPGLKEVTLTVEDSDGAATADPNDFKCTASSLNFIPPGVNITFPLPEWKEIPPTF